MPIYQYAPYYQYNETNKFDAMRDELSSEDVAHRLELVSKDIGAYFEDVDAQIQVNAQGIVCLTTDLARKDCDERVKRCLNTLDLYAKKVAN